MKNSKCKFSLILHLFFLDCFVKNNFIVNNESFLREYAIKKYIYTSHCETLYIPVKNMLENNYYTNKLVIHNDFPRDLLVNIFRPYLYYYYIIHFSIKGTEKIHKYKNKLDIKFRKFYEYNSLFGRKICSGKRRGKFIRKPFNFKFNTDHISFFKKKYISTTFETISDPNELFYDNNQSVENNTESYDNSSDSDSENENN
jgi:hypothetical protein